MSLFDGLFNSKKNDKPTTPTKRSPQSSPRPLKAKPTPSSEEALETIEISEEELEKQLEGEYYKQDFDPTEFFLERLGDANEHEINERLNIKNKQLDIITTKLSASVMKNYGSFVQGMSEIRELGNDIQSTAQICRNGRANLRRANFELISGPVNIIATQRKTLLYRQVLQYLLKIKRVKEIEDELKQAVEMGDYLRAVELCKESKKEVEIFRMFNCVKALDNEVQHIFHTVKEKLSNSLLEVTRNFSPVAYGKILAAYSLSDSADTVLSKLQTYFIDSVSSSSRDLLYAHVIMTPENVLKAETLKKKEFKDLCTYLQEDHFMQCLNTIFEYLCELMYSHHCMREWHIQQEMEGGKFGEFVDVRKGLEECSSKIWKKMEKRVTRMIQTSSLPTFKIDSFLEVLDAVNKLIEIGEEFSGTRAGYLRDCINQQSKNYFTHFHKKKAEDLKDVLDNEIWEAMPLDNINDIKEFRNFIQNTSFQPSIRSNSSLISRKSLSSYYVNGNPFSKLKPDLKDGNASDDEDEELKKDFVDEGEVVQDTKHKIILPSRNLHNKNNNHDKEEFPMLSMSCTNLLKQIGIYLQMMKTLQPIAVDIFIGLTQLYNYFLFSILYFFTSKPVAQSAPLTSSSNINVSTLLNSVRGVSQQMEQEPLTPRSFIDGVGNVRLRNVALSIYDTLFDITPEINAQKKARFFPPTLSPQVSLSSPKRNFAISERIVAAESLIFLANSMNIIKPFIMGAINENLSMDFYKQAVDIAGEVKKEIIITIIPKFISLSDIPIQIEKVKWSTNDIGDNNPYVNVLIKDFQKLDEKLKELKKGGIINESASSLFMECSISSAMDHMIEGFSRVKKCTDQGRVLMSLDCQVFQTAMQKFTEIRNKLNINNGGSFRPIPKAAIVDNYIKGFYKRSEEFVNWTKAHIEDYSIKQLQSLASLIGANINNKKQRTDFLKEVDDCLMKKKE